MAKRVIYSGPSCNLGRFGKVKKGQAITLTEQEWNACKNQDEFTLEDTSPATQEQVPLKDTPHFRFTSLPWGTDNIFRVVRRKGRSQLTSMAHGLLELGLPCSLSPDMTREQMADVVLEAAGAAGWLPE